jgi:hypothetical protein
MKEKMIIKINQKIMGLIIIIIIITTMLLIMISRIIIR